MNKISAMLISQGTWKKYSAEILKAGNRIGGG